MAEAQGSYEVVLQGKKEVLRINASSWSYSPSLEGSPLVMATTIDKLAEVPRVSQIVFKQRRNFTYNYDQTQMLIEVATIYNHLVKSKKVLSLQAMGYTEETSAFFAEKYGVLQTIVLTLLRSDPIGAYVELLRLSREEKVLLQKETNLDFIEARENYLQLLDYIYQLLDKTKLISIVKNNLAGYELGDRTLYKTLFRAVITPDFMFTQLMARHPPDGEQIDVYSLEDTEVTIYKTPQEIKMLYHVFPPEFKLTEDEYTLVDLARNVLAEYKPKEEEFLDPQRMRTTFFNIGKDLLQELAQTKGLVLEYDRIKLLAQVLVRYTVGFGLIEILLKDPKIQDITVNSPIGETTVFLVHQDYGECYTNIIPSKEDADSWATKFRLLSGRPLDEANPVLDTELILPGSRSRVAIITLPLSPNGLAYAFRRARDNPWTLPLFVQNKMISPLGAGLLSFMVDGGRSILFAGTRSSGKTSLLGSILVEIMRKYRILTIEDSVTGDCPILIKKNGKIISTSVGTVIDTAIEAHGCWYSLSDHEISGNNDHLEVLAMDKKGKIKWQPVSKLIRHKVNKPIYEITTRTGRKIKVTGDHSLFSLGKNASIIESRVKYLKKGNHIATPRNIPTNFKPVFSINLLQNLEKFEKGYILGEGLHPFMRKHKHEIIQLAKEYKHNRSLRDKWFRDNILPIRIIKDLNCIGYSIPSLKDVYFKYSGNAHTIPVKIEFDQDFLTFIGLWIADGCYDTSSVLVSVVEEENRQIVRNVAKKYGLSVKFHSDTFTLMINSLTLKKLMQNVLHLTGNAYTKRIPDWIFNLSQKQVSYVLKGIFSGDGCVADKEITIPLSSRGLLEDIQTLLLQFDILLRIGTMRKDKTYNASITALKFWKLFRDKIGILPQPKQDLLHKLCSKASTHDVTDVIPLSLRDKKNLFSKPIKPFFKTNYVSSGGSIGRERLKNALSQIPFQENPILKNLQILQQSDLFWDQIREIKVIEDFNDYVYDFSVPECESFICGNIIAHNTLELPTETLRSLGYNIQPLKVRSALSSGGGEVPADEGIRTSLRLGDSSLIVGEIRSLEAKAMFEAMRIGALANVVAGTVHGASPYAVFDRVVNDLEVPKTSFKAVDLIVVSNPVRSANGLKSFKRVLQITEVRKHWQDDPQAEKAFVDLMLYNSKTDMLEPTKDLITGESEVLKQIGGNVQEWAGNWDGIWNNILLRARMKETLTQYATKSKVRSLLEAPFVIQSNDMFHQISGDVKEEVGFLDPKQIYLHWENWLKREIKKQKL